MRTVIPRNYNGTNAISTASYYSFGMIMPGATHSLNPSHYRYGYQGQFAEKDPETGLNSFDARMYDVRLGRWLTTDPAGQFWSPYLGMGNIPNMAIDPDGRTALMKLMDEVFNVLVDLGEQLIDYSYNKAVGNPVDEKFKPQLGRLLFGSGIRVLVTGTLETIVFPACAAKDAKRIAKFYKVSAIILDSYMDVSNEGEVSILNFTSSHWAEFLTNTTFGLLTDYGSEKIGGVLDKLIGNPSLMSKVEGIAVGALKLLSISVFNTLGNILNTVTNIIRKDRVKDVNNRVDKVGPIK